MKGLLYREWTLLWDTWRWLLLIGLLQTLFVCFLFWEAGMLTCALWSAVPLGIFFNEEQQHLEKPALTLPVSRSDLVTARYLLSLLLVLINAAFCMFHGAFWPYLFEGALDTAAYLKSCKTILCLSLLIPSFCFPPMYALGAVRGCIADIVVVALFFGFVHLWRRFTNIALTDLFFWTQPILFILSWRLSIRVYSRREF